MSDITIIPFAEGEARLDWIGLTEALAEAEKESVEEWAIVGRALRSLRATTWEDIHAEHFPASPSCPASLLQQGTHVDDARIRLSQVAA